MSNEIENIEEGGKKKKQKKEKESKPSFVLAKDWFKEKNLPWSGKRATVFAVYYSFPSNQNAGGSTGTNVIVQKVIPWGDDSEPRIYISPYALKRRIRDYWVKNGEKVYLREDKALIKDDLNKVDLSYIDVDLFGFMSAKEQKSAEVRPGPVTSWGAVSLETFHSDMDFNTCVLSTTGSESGGSIINRNISKEFYFTSFYINPDLIAVDPTNGKGIGKEGKETEEPKHILEMKRERILKFFEGLKYAMQKDSGGARDRPDCVIIGIAVGDKGYPNADKKVFRSIKIENDKIVQIDLEGVEIIHCEQTYFKNEIKTKRIEEVIEKLI